ncbi:hypothetical protein ACHAPC_007141 [Botrytis cinerea]|uniref:Uncharacterized protein n=1 Tax=Botryotinia fuckeliana (strain BcDW1) TaxID=1290391 RepID=M7U2T6_BOTF1|nr:hypothetical protein BcDW1_1036 [Botrytis cinerea BcDW1]
MAPSRKSKYLAMMPGAAEGDSELGIQEFETSLQEMAIEIENAENTLNDTVQELRQRFITSTGAINKYESTKHVAASINTKKTGVQGDGIEDTIKEVIEEVTIGVLDEAFIQKVTPDEESAKQTDSKDIVSKEVVEQDKI